MEDPQKIQNTNNNLKTVKTYMSDMAETVRQNEISVIKVALAEQERHEREDLYRQIEGSPRKKIFWALGGIILIGISIYGVYYFIKQKKTNDTPAVAAREESIISYDKLYEVDVDNESNLSEKIKTITSDAGNENESINYIKFYNENNGIKEKTSLEILFKKLSFLTPQSLIHSLSDNYMIGSYIKKSNDNPDDPRNKPNIFIILQTKDYEYSYAGMLEWEKTLLSDISPLIDEDQNNKTTGLWKDTLVNNKDARVITDDAGKPLIYYLFLDKNNLVIARDTNTIKEIIGRLMIKNIKPI